MKKKEEKKLINTTPLYVLLVALFIAYFAFQGYGSLSLIIGSTLFFVIIATIALEIANGIKEDGITKNIIEIVLAVAVVLGLWYGLRFLLHTSNPLDVVPSCSMLPVLQRGDMILVQGANQVSIKAPIVNITEDEFNESFSSTGTEALQCVAYNKTQTSIHISQVAEPGYDIGLLRTSNGTSAIIPASAQTGVVKFICGTVPVTFTNGTVVEEAATVGIGIGNRTIYGDKNNSIVVYQTEPQDLFYQEGDSYIVHRAYAILNASGSYYTLTKGDNNPGLDLQYYNSPASMADVQGTVIASVPYLGYLKLVLSNNFVEPTGCNYTTGS